MNDKHMVVIGLGFGDEGKGVVTDYLTGSCGGSVAVARFSGGHQAGHTVEYNNIRHVFSNFGSGSLRGVPTIWSKFCTIDPVGICRELKVLRSKGIEPILYIDPACPITTPYDKMANTSCKTTINNGSCGVGFGATIEREEKLYSLLAGDLFYPSVFERKLSLIRSNYYKADGSIFWEKSFLEYCKQLLKERNIQIRPYTAERIAFEGSQGLMLDKNIGFFPHVTRSNTDLTNIKKLGYNPQVYLVTRAYQTRHGNGPMTNEDIPHNIIRDPKETNVTHQYQGEFRISMLDANLLKYAYYRSGIKECTLCITCLEHVDGEYKFTFNGQIFSYKNAVDFGLNLGYHVETHKILLFKNHVLMGQ